MAETITTPGTPTGAAAVRVDVAATYTTTGATSSLGDALEYRWTWDTGVLSSWAADLAVAHTYTTTGSRSVTVQARCIAHPTILSAASAVLTVMVYHDEAVAATPVYEVVGVARTTEVVAA